MDLIHRDASSASPEKGSGSAALSSAVDMGVGVEGDDGPEEIWEKGAATRGPPGVARLRDGTDGEPGGFRFRAAAMGARGSMGLLEGGSMAMGLGGRATVGVSTGAGVSVGLGVLLLGEYG